MYGGEVVNGDSSSEPNIHFLFFGRGRTKKKKYDPRNLDGTMYKNHSLPTSYSESGAVEVLSKSTEADDVELVPNRGVEESAIYDNLIGQGALYSVLVLGVKLGFAPNLILLQFQPFDKHCFLFESRKKVFLHEDNSIAKFHIHLLL